MLMYMEPFRWLRRLSSKIPRTSQLTVVCGTFYYLCLIDNILVGRATYSLLWVYLLDAKPDFLQMTMLRQSIQAALHDVPALQT